MKTFLMGLLLAASMHAAEIYDVRLDVSELVGQGDFDLYFQFVNQNGVNTVTVNGISVAPAETVSMPTPPGAAFTDATIAFQATEQWLLFRVALDTNAVDPLFPDFFGFGLNDASGVPLPTTDPLGTDFLLAVDLTNSGPQIATYAGSGLLTTEPEVSRVPEPASWLLAGAGLAALGLRQYRRN